MSHYGTIVIDEVICNIHSIELGEGLIWFHARTAQRDDVLLNGDGDMAVHARDGSLVFWVPGGNYYVPAEAIDGYINISLPLRLWDPERGPRPSEVEHHVY